MKQPISILLPFAPNALARELRRARLLVEEFNGTLENTTPGVFAGAPATLWRVRFEDRDDGTFFARIINQATALSE